MLNIFQTSSNNSTALRMQNRGVVSIFGAGYPGCDLAAWVPNAPKMEGESKGGDLPSWHTTFGESLVCYTFCPGWRGKGTVQSGADAFPHQEIRRQNGASAIIPPPDFRRDKRYIQPPSLVLRPAVATPHYQSSNAMTALAGSLLSGRARMCRMVCSANTWLFIVSQSASCMISAALFSKSN